MAGCLDRRRPFASSIHKLRVPLSGVKAHMGRELPPTLCPGLRPSVKAGAQRGPEGCLDHANGPRLLPVSSPINPKEDGEVSHDTAAPDHGGR